jgi:hypothetical protein
MYLASYIMGIEQECKFCKFAKYIIYKINKFFTNRVQSDISSLKYLKTHSEGNLYLFEKLMAD